MFRLMTYKGIALLNTEVDTAYRRRRSTNAPDHYPCVLLDVLDERALLIALLDRRRRYENGRNWLRNLRRDVDALARSSREPREPSGRRRAPSLRASRAQPKAPRERPRRREP